MVEFELLRSPKEIIEVIELLLGELKQLDESDETDPFVFQEKVRECRMMVQELCDLDSNGIHKETVDEMRKELGRYKSMCNVCAKNEVEGETEVCEFCTKAQEHLNKNNCVRDLYGLAVSDPQAFFNLCGYTCYACGLQIPKENVKFCSKCKVVCYCNRHCQRQHWNGTHGHRKECKRVGLDFEKELDEDRLIQLRALSQASLMSVYYYAIEKLKAKNQ